MNKLSIKRGLKFFHTLVLHIPMVESYRKTLLDRSIEVPAGVFDLRPESEMSEVEKRYTAVLLQATGPVAL